MRPRAHARLDHQLRSRAVGPGKVEQSTGASGQLFQPEQVAHIDIGKDRAVVLSTRQVLKSLGQAIAAAPGNTPDRKRSPLDAKAAATAIPTPFRTDSVTRNRCSTPRRSIEGTAPP